MAGDEAADAGGQNRRNARGNRMGASRAASVTLACLIAAGCAATDQFDSRAARFDEASERVRDEMILTNVVRASRAEPLQFMQLGRVTGTSSTSGQLGLPSVVFGAPLPPSGPTSTLVFGADPQASSFSPNMATLSGSTSFDVTPAETQDFYRGLLLTVEPETLAFFSEQGVARETLFYLFTEKVVEEKRGKVAQFLNDPLDPNFKAFQRYVDLATRYGLSAEPEPASKSVSALNGDASDSGGRGAHSAHWRLCFDRALWGAGVQPARNRPLCGSSDRLKNERMVSFVDGDGVETRLQVFPRSTYSIFQFLGRIVAAGDSGRIKLHTEEAIGREPLADDDLFFLADDGRGDCFLRVSYHGQAYCVPENGAINTKRVLGLLAQLLALNTSIRDVAITPEVRLVQ